MVTRMVARTNGYRGRLLADDLSLVILSFIYEFAPFAAKRMIDLFLFWAVLAYQIQYQ